jgi:hypothetical protein
MRRNIRKHVEEALLKRALGFSYSETRTESAGEGKEKTVVVEKHTEPDVRSILFWLTNRYPKRWGVRPPIDEEDAAKRINELVDSNRKAAEAVLGSERERDGL